MHVYSDLKSFNNEVIQGEEVKTVGLKLWYLGFQVNNKLDCRHNTVKHKAFLRYHSENTGIDMRSQ